MHSIGSFNAHHGSFVSEFNCFENFFVAMHSKLIKNMNELLNEVVRGCKSLGCWCIYQNSVVNGCTSMT